MEKWSVWGSRRPRWEDKRPIARRYVLKSERLHGGTCAPAHSVTFEIARGLDSAETYYRILFLRSWSSLSVPGPWPCDYLRKFLIRFLCWYRHYRPLVLVLQADWCRRSSIVNDKHIGRPPQQYRLANK